MKNQYFGDIKDYLKYGLLRILAREGGFRVGVCWMLTPPEEVGGGRSVEYLEDPDGWRELDPPLFDLLARSVSADGRDVQSLERSDLLPGARFHSTPLPREPEDRSAYFQRMLASFGDLDLVFFDPDVGLEGERVPSRRADSVRYLAWDELVRTYGAGHSVLVYQHFPREPHRLFVEQRVRELLARTGAPEAHSFRWSAAHVVFLLAVQPDHVRGARHGAERASEVWGEVVEVRRWEGEPGPPPTDLLSVGDYREAARARLPQMAWDYYDSGAHDEITVRENRAAFDRLSIRYRVLRDVSRRDLAVRILDASLSMPLLVAPTAFHGLACPEGERATARAAGRAGTAMILSTLSNTAMEEVLEAAEGPVWFQLYVYRDRGVTEGLVRRAEEAGCEALVLTVDAPLLGRRERDVRNRFHLPNGLSVRNLLPAGRERLPETAAESGLAAYVNSLFDPSLDWSDLEWLCQLTRLPVLVKGIVHPEDGRLAVEHGAAGVVVSNHGGRQLDTSLATVTALPEVAGAVDGRGAVLLDGGVRRGTDILKALALGADAVAVGRPVLWGLSVDGERGAHRILEILREELDLALALSGCASIAEVRGAGADLLVRSG